MDAREKLLVIYSANETELDKTPFNNEKGQTIVLDRLEKEDDTDRTVITYTINNKKQINIPSITDGANWIENVYKRIPNTIIKQLKEEQPYLFDGTLKKEAPQRQKQLFEELNPQYENNPDNIDTALEIYNYLLQENDLAPLSNDLNILLQKVKKVIDDYNK